MKRLAWAALLLPLPLLAVGFELTGQVKDNHQAPIGGLTVSLRPPAKEKRVQRVTSTDSSGHFTFQSLPQGRYLLEVFQGTTPVYRQVITIDKHTPELTVPVTRR